MLARTMLIACLSAGTLSRVAYGDDPNDLYLGLKQERLFAALGLQAVGLDAGAGEPVEHLGKGGLLYMFAKPNAPAIQDIALAVYASTAQARAAFQLRSLMVPIGPSSAPADVPGDDFAWWRSVTGKASFVIRRANIVWFFSPERPADEGLALARQIDGLIRDDRKIAPRGTWIEVPEIVSPGAPDSAAKGARVSLAPEFRQLGDRAALRIVVTRGTRYGSLTETRLDGKSLPQIHIRGPRADSLMDVVRDRTPDEDGRFILRIPNEVGQLKLTMIVATPDNVIVTKDFTINVTE